jgi:hypothetical protein
MIRSLIAASVLSLVSLSAHAYDIADFLGEKETQEYVANLRQSGFDLAQVSDPWAEKGIRPRCLCSNYKMRFVSYLNGRKEVQTIDAHVTLRPGQTTIQFSEASSESAE